jgi:hypothetical protein
MAGLSDSVTLRSVSIPGTHESATYAGTCRTVPHANTQALDISTQLLVGTRFLDLHLVHVSDTLRVYHGALDCGVALDGVLGPVASFLALHPSEVVMARVMDENSELASGNTRSFGATLQAYVTAFATIVWANPTNVWDPTIGTVRCQHCGRGGGKGGRHRPGSPMSPCAEATHSTAYNHLNWEERRHKTALGLSFPPDWHWHNGRLCVHT